MFDREIFDEARREFLSHLRYAKGHRETTCYAYHLTSACGRTGFRTPARTAQRAWAADVEQWSAWQLRRAAGERPHRHPAPEHPEQLLPLGAEARDRRERSGVLG